VPDRVRKQTTFKKSGKESGVRYQEGVTPKGHVIDTLERKERKQDKVRENLTGEEMAASGQ